MSCKECGDHCYAKALNKVGDGRKVYDEEQFCPKCSAHLSASGICLNACHLSAESMKRFQSLLTEKKP